MLQSMADLERTWNHKFNYPWIFFNDKPFTEDFKKKTRAATKAEVRYGMSPIMDGPLYNMLTKYCRACTS
jgi:mannosyltransferase